MRDSNSHPFLGLPPAWVMQLTNAAAGRFGRDAQDEEPFDPGTFADPPDGDTDNDRPAPPD